MSFQSGGAVTPTPGREDAPTKRSSTNPFDSDSMLGISAEANERSATCCGRCCSWYFFPLRHIGYSVSCALYCGLNCVLALGLFILASFVIPLSVSLLVLCCAGVIVFYISSEFQLFFAIMDLAMAFYMTEDDPRVINRGGPKLGYRTRRIPSCSDSCAGRIKLLLSDGQTYKILIYNLLFKPFAAFITFFALIFLACVVWGLIMWIFFLVHPSWLRNYTCYPLNIRYEWNSKCLGWDITSTGESIGLCFAVLPFLAIGLRVTILAAKLSKMVTYFFLTDYYLAEEVSLLRPPDYAQANVNTNMNQRYVYGTDPNEL